MSDTKLLLKRIATETVQRTGVQSSTLRDLGAAAGIKSSSVVYHFQNKQGLIHSVAEDYGTAALQQLQEIRENKSSPRARLLGLVDMFESFLAQDKMCLCGSLAADAHQLDESTRILVEKIFEQVEHWVAEVLIAGNTDLGSEQARRQSQIILASLEGALLLDKNAGTAHRLSAVRAWLEESFGE